MFHLNPNRRFGLVLSASLLVLGLAGCASGPKESPWPEQIVSIEDMHPLTPWTAPVPLPEPGKVRDRSHASVVTVEAHVDTDGKVLKVRLQTEGTSGSSVLDQAALQRMRSMAFPPYRVAGSVQEVTVVAPMRFPFYDRDR